MNKPDRNYPLRGYSEWRDNTAGTTPQTTKKLPYYMWVERFLFYLLFLPLGAFLLWIVMATLLDKIDVQHTAALNIVFLVVGILIGKRQAFYSKLFR